MDRFKSNFIFKELIIRKVIQGEKLKNKSIKLGD